MLSQYNRTISTGRVVPNSITAKEKENQPVGTDTFSQILQKNLQKTEGLTFTKHAQQRMNQREMVLTDEHMEKLDEAVKKAGEKGVRESLILMDKMAFIVSVPNQTVVTAMNRQDMEGNVFTNIDGAVVV
ncbi:MAG: hypothetical protein BGN88_08775 [Clostridiales bacterium 43-6]|nr:MAG: hypothetical protein BGN88_08775 [Clostridiales bacterium 43-6]